MDELTLRAQLAKTLHREDVPEPLWQRLVRKDFVKDAQDQGFENGMQNLVDEARDLLDLLAALSEHRKPPGRIPQTVYEEEDLLNSTELKRTRALALYLARQAATTPLVRDFRME